MAKRKIPRPLSWVKLKKDIPQSHRKQYVKGLGKETFLLFIGEIANQPGHCVILNPDTNKYQVGWHTDNFIEMTAEEV